MGAATRYMILIGLVAAVAACVPAENASIVSVPSAALVSVNGKTIGRTPAKYLFEFPEDFTRYTVRGSKAGYHDSVVVVSHNRLARSGRVRLRLEPQNIAATITSDPSEASVLIGETEIGQTPVQHSFNFSNRNHRYVVTASKPGFFDGVGSEEAPVGACLRPPLKRLVQFSRKPLSQRCLIEGSRKESERSGVQVRTRQ